MLNTRLILFADKDKGNKDLEIDLFDFTRELILNLHDELNKEIKEKKEAGYNDINIEENNKKEEIDYTNEESVLSSCSKKYFGQFRSKISEQFYSVSKTIIECPECLNIMQYSTTIIYACGMFPYRASLYVKKKN